MAGKRANGEGSISYDKRRKRYRAKITIGSQIVGIPFPISFACFTCKGFPDTYSH